LLFVDANIVEFSAYVNKFLKKITIRCHSTGQGLTHFQTPC